MTADQYRKKIQKCDKSALKKLWNSILMGKTPGWDNGMAFQYMIIRAFELEKNVVTYPYEVLLPGKLRTLEQIDGVVYLKGIQLPILIESKDFNPNIPIDPIAKVRGLLQKRPTHLIASMFVTSGFTEPALYNHTLVTDRTILLWVPDDITVCFKIGFTDGMIRKYRFALEHGKNVLNLKTDLGL
jgi:hypothetical protein